MPDVDFYRAALFVISMCVLAVIIAGCTFWIRWFAGKARFNVCGDPTDGLITRLPQRVPRWSIFDFVLMFGMMILVASFLSQRAMKEAAMAQSLDTSAEITPEIPATINAETVDAATVDAEAADSKKDNARKLPVSDLIRIQLTAGIIAACVALIFIRVVHQVRFVDMGILPTVLDIRRGAVATVWLLAPVLLINVVVSQLVQYEHAVTDMMAEHRDIRTFSFLFFSAAIVTPIVEEFQFRMLLQGGLQKLADPVLPSQPTDIWSPQQIWPILVTSAVFASLHLGQGAAPIPLFFLSVGLGFLYRNTGRLTPVIVVHMLLNGTTLCMEFARYNAGLE